MENEPVRYYFKQAFYGEDCCEEIIKIIQNLKIQKIIFPEIEAISGGAYFVSLWVRVERVLSCEHDAGDEDTEQDQVTKVWMVAQPVTS